MAKAQDEDAGSPETQDEDAGSPGTQFGETDHYLADNDPTPANVIWPDAPHVEGGVAVDES